MKKYIAYFTDGTKYSFYAPLDVFEADKRAQDVARSFGKKLAYWE